MWLRRVTLIAPAMLVVSILGSAFGLRDQVLVSCIPTIAAALVLERKTRRADDAPVPVVTVRR